jgi:hypothetical protein
MEVPLYMFIHCHQNAGQNHNIKTDGKSFENVAKFGYSGITVTKQNCINKQIRSKIKSENGCYYSVHNILSFSLVSENVRIQIHKTTILSVVLYGHETWFLTLREEHSLKVLENTVLQRIFGQEAGKNCMMGSFTICTLH